MQNENSSEIYDALWYYYTHPLDINKADEKQLAGLFFLTSPEIKSILDYRKTYLGFKSLNEFYYVENLSPEKAEWLRYFVAIYSESPNSLTPQTFTGGKHQFFLKNHWVLEKQKGYQKTENNQPVYEGSSIKSLVKYRYQTSGNFDAGWVAEKDAGEAFLRKSNPYGFDFYSAFASLGFRGRFLKKIYLGDYHLTTGEGLVSHTAFGFSKSADVLQLAKNSKGIRPYFSSLESGFLRGIALEAGIKNFSTLFYVSSIRRDGNIRYDSTGQFNYFSSFDNSGYHRTQTEINKENQISHQTAGLNMELNSRHLLLGTNMVINIFTPVYLPDNYLTTLHPEGISRVFNTSLYYRYSYKNIFSFGELASYGSHVAGLAGINIILTENFHSSLLYRNYSPAYYAPLSSAFGESSRTSNEKGLYWGFQYSPSGNINIRFYTDRFSFIEPVYHNDLSTIGYEYFTQIDYRNYSHTYAYFRLKWENKNQNDNQQETLNHIVPINKLSLRFHLHGRINYNSGLDIRAEWKKSWNEQDNPTGFMMYEELFYKLNRYPVRFYFRYYLFDVQDYLSAIYSFENDVMYSFTSQVFSGSGSRFYFLVKARFRKNLWMETRISRTFYFDRDSVGSGYEEIQAAHKTQLSMILNLLI